MIDLDSNVILRAITGDDPVESPLARGFLATLPDDRPGVIGNRPMIHESTPWKRELRRSASMLSTWRRKPHTELGYVLLEKHVFLSAFIVRKLVDSHKVTDALRVRPVEARFFPAKKDVLGGVTSAAGKAFLDDVYDLETSEVRSISVRDLVNQIIHSFFFAIVPGDAEETFLFFNSDRTKGEFVIELPMSCYAQLLRGIARDRVRSFSITVDRLTGKTVVALT